jgi:hypothetical protein
MTVRHQSNKSVPNATQVKPGVYVANTSTSVFRSAPPPPKKK